MSKDFSASVVAIPNSSAGTPSASPCILSFAADPTVTGVKAPQGSLGLRSGVSPALYSKVGSLDTGWVPLGDLSTFLAMIATTGSATDLGGGTVPAGRMPALTGDVTSVAGSTTTAISAGAVMNANLYPAPGYSVIGNNGSATAGPGYITATTDGQVLQLVGTTLGFDTIPTFSTQVVQCSSVTTGHYVAGGTPPHGPFDPFLFSGGTTDNNAQILFVHVLSVTGDVTIEALAGGFDGRIVIMRSDDASTATVQVVQTMGNNILTTVGSMESLVTQGVILMYDATAGVWVQVNK